MSRVMRSAAVICAATVGSTVLGILPAWALAPSCTAFAQTPTFSGSRIYGHAGGTCTSDGGPATINGRIKEDRPLGQPDAVHQTKGYYPAYYSYDHFMDKTTCQDGDAIYLEGQAYDSGASKVTQSARRTMNC
jgi:hypothetical protein